MQKVAKPRNDKLSERLCDMKNQLDFVDEVRQPNTFGTAKWGVARFPVLLSMMILTR